MLFGLASDLSSPSTYLDFVDRFAIFSTALIHRNFAPDAFCFAFEKDPSSG